ncbi:c-type cytochrome [Poseidonocella sedimentorum]|uniref:Cytochrome c n=1 Tax=Poseidonocella sedimentorum TaxID=871652 RepID=A0A1I6D3I7_9RHOB|nr:c-type cytochrome [Poseidonocella sedimentorum]SFQ99913.1 cytochrome c [Poseidonocella sedimentorum]
MIRAALLFCVVAGPLAAEGFQTLKGHGGPIMDIAVHGPSDQIASASFDNSVGLWQGGVPRWLEAHDAAVMSAAWIDERRLVTGGDDFSLRLWDLGSDRPLRMDGHAGKVASVAVSPSGARIASASWDGRIGLWTRGGVLQGYLEDHDGAVNDVAFTPDGAGLYSVSADGTLRHWSLATGDARVILSNGFGINTLALPVSGNWLAFGAVDGVTKVIDPVSGAVLADMTLDRRPILAMALNPDETRLAVGDGDGFIMVLDTATWRVVHDFRAALRGPIWALGWAEGGEALLAAGIEDVIYSWPLTGLDAFEPDAPEEQSFLRDPDSMGNGERQFMRKCSICHEVTPGPSRRAGPSLHALFGRPAASVPGYTYSQTLLDSGIIWSEETIDGLFDLGPEHYIPGSKMPMQRIVERSDRADLIDYLKRATRPEEN